MATIAPSEASHATSPRAGIEGYFATMSTIMALFVFTAFSVQLGLGRSTFASPLRVHFHAVTFMGWVTIFLLQSWLATRGPLQWHRRLGWLAVGWMGLMVASAMWVIVMMARNGTMPFFFVPQQLLIGDPLTLLCFIGLTTAAVRLRRRTDWHARLHICGMAALMGPAFGRLIPMPLFIPVAFEVSNLLALVFPVAGMMLDRRRSGTAHRAWLWGIAAIVATQALTDAITYSPLGDAIYQAATADSPGAAVPGLAYPPPPEGPLMTGREASI